MPNNTKHTPTPYKVGYSDSSGINEYDDSGLPYTRITDGTDQSLGECESERDAQFIVKACNEHYLDKAKIREQEKLIEELMEALKKDSSRFKRILQTIDDIVMVGNGTRKAELMNYIQQCEVEVSQAINKATGGR